MVVQQREDFDEVTVGVDDRMREPRPNSFRPGCHATPSSWAHVSSLRAVAT